MNKFKLFKTGAIMLIVLGMMHLVVRFFGRANDPVLDKLLADMQNYKINFLGEHSFLKFNDGFSIMMGFLISAFGIQSLLLTKEILANRHALLFTIILTAIAFGIAVWFFHVLAYGFLFISLMSFILAFVRNKAQAIQ